MPIFAYQCRGCGHRFDELQRLGAPPLTDCPECGRPELDKLLSAPNFHLKGSGWRKSDAAPKAPSTRPKYAHTFDSPVPHADHHDHGHGHGHGHGHSHSHDHHHGHDSGGAAIPRPPHDHDQ